MSHNNKDVANILQQIDLGSSVAEHDNLLANARVETSTFTDLINDRVDLVPGTKGSGKSALFRILVEFLPEFLFDQNKVVIAHGVDKLGDNVFHAYKDKFEKLDEDEFTSFWCIYLVSLAHEHFIKGGAYQNILADTKKEVRMFQIACQKARIPEINAKKSLYDILDWSLHILKQWKPTIKFELPDPNFPSVTLDLFGGASEVEANPDYEPIPRYIVDIKTALEAILEKSDLTIWLMIDRLDEVFPRRSQIERLGLRGLLRAIRPFSSARIRVKIFLRDDMLQSVVAGPEGFTALTHLTARQADTLRWSEDGILTMLANRLFLNEALTIYLEIDPERLHASRDYREECFYKVFPKQVHSGRNQSSTLRWIYSRTQDGRGVVTPRDVIELLNRAIQRQQDDYSADPSGETESIISSKAIQYGLEELSKQKRTTFLQAEFPHLWEHIEKFVAGKTEYSEKALKSLLGRNWKTISEDLIAIGLFRKQGGSNNAPTYWVPYLYRKGLELTQGRA